MMLPLVGIVMPCTLEQGSERYVMFTRTADTRAFAEGLRRLCPTPVAAQRMTKDALRLVLQLATTLGEKQRITHVATVGMSGKSARELYGIRSPNERRHEMDAKLAAYRKLREEFNEFVTVEGEDAASLAGPPTHLLSFPVLFTSQL